MIAIGTNPIYAVYVVFAALLFELGSYIPGVDTTVNGRFIGVL